MILANVYSEISMKKKSEQKSSAKDTNTRQSDLISVKKKSNYQIS